MNLFRLLRKGLLLLVVLFGLAACGQKGPLILPPKNTPPQAVNPVIFPEQDGAGDNQVPTENQASGNVQDSPGEGQASGDAQGSSKETPLGILPSTTRHKPMNAR